MYVVGGLMASGAGIQAVQAVFLLLLVFVAMFAGLARRLKLPYPILLVIAGLLLSFLPEMPRIGLDPNLVFLVFLPPLLYSAAWTLSWREFQHNFVSIAMLAVGLVLFTVVGLAQAQRYSLSASSPCVSISRVRFPTKESCYGWVSSQRDMDWP
jgi:NhaP-type Na+/H+ or K+/H+ antiporter